MRAKITYLVTAAVLVFYFLLVGSRGVLLIKTGTLLTVTFGVCGCPQRMWDVSRCRW